MELTNTMTVDSRRMLEASARSFMLLLLSSSRWIHIHYFVNQFFSIGSSVSSVGMRVQHTISEPIRPAAGGEASRTGDGRGQHCSERKSVAQALDCYLGSGSGGGSKIGAGGGNRTHGLGIMRPSLFH